jgi:hypothetical protein
MSLNLLDVVTVQKPKPANLNKAELEELNAARFAAELSLNTIGKAMAKSNAARSVKYSEECEAMATAGKIIAAQQNAAEIELMTAFFHRTGSLPANAEQQAIELDTYYRNDVKVEKGLGRIDVIDRFNQTPRVAMPDLMEISRIANMIVIPFDYLNPQSYKDESYEMRQSIQRFRDAAVKASMQMYVICPLRHYSILEHLRATDANLPIAANAFSQNFDVLGMMMPAMMMFSDKLQNLEGDIRQLYSKVDTLDAGMKGVVRGMESMTQKLDALQATVEKQQLELIRQKAEQAEIKRAEQARAAERTRAEYVWYMPYEPLAFAVPKGKTILDADFGYLGPCWGPDFDAIVAAALELSVRKGQRAKLENVIDRLW